jgi:Putative DNA-binding domain
MDTTKLRGSQSAEEARSAASWALATNKHLLGRVIRRSAFVGVRGEARNLLTVFTAEGRGDTERLRDRIDYHGGLVLEEAEVALESVETVIAQRFEHVPVVGLQQRVPSRFTIAHWPSYNGISLWPGTILWLEPSEKTEIAFAHEPVTGPGTAHDYFPDMYSAAAAWCRLPDFNGAADTRVGGFAVFLPELRARLGGVACGAGEAEVEVHHNGALDGWRVKGGHFDRGQWVSFNVAATAPTATVPFHGHHISVALVDPAGNIVDLWRSTDRTARRPVVRKVPATRDLVDHVTSCLDMGECQTVECKPPLNPGAGGEKIRELVEVVLGFANTGGGSVLVGVNNHLVPRDLLESAEFRKWRANSAADNDDTEALRQYGSALIDALRSLLDKLPEMVAHTVSFRGANILLLSVATGTDLPYYDREGTIWVRRGASVRRAHPEREPHLFLSVNRS